MLRCSHSRTTRSVAYRKALLDLHGRIASEDDAQVVQARVHHAPKAGTQSLKERGQSCVESWNALVNFVKLLQPAFEYDPQDLQKRHKVLKCAPANVANIVKTLSMAN
eukprot:3178789-Amphidinium_carterae.1